MVLYYSYYIIDGRLTIDDVPSRWSADTAAVIDYYHQVKAETITIEDVPEQYKPTVAKLISYNM